MSGRTEAVILALRRGLIGLEDQMRTRLQQPRMLYQIVLSAFLPFLFFGLLSVGARGEALRLQWATCGWLLLGALGALVALFVSVRRVTRPLDALTREAQRVVAGECYRPLSPTGPPELRALIMAVNQMVTRLEAQQAALQEYTREVLRSQEAERQRISRDLHDETMQGLVGLAGRIELCRKALVEGATDEVGARLAELHTLARDALADVQRMSRHLRPRMLEDLGLPAALQALCEELARHMPMASARVHCEIVGTPLRLPDELELTAFRVVQEALTNVRKHARRATRVNVTLSFEDGELLTLIEDDGPGFTPDTSESWMREGHLGLAGMRERARLFGGELMVISAPGEGTYIRLRLPYPSELT